MKAVRITGNVFILVGATFLFFVLYELVGTSAVTRQHQSALAQEFDEDFRHPPPPRPDETFEPVKWPRLDSGDVVARIKIPKIDVNMIVVQGVTLGDLALGPGHYPRTPLPGQPGSVGIAGHRTGWGSPFINLDRLRKGDEIVLETTKRGTYRYRVTGTTVVPPTEVEVLLGDPKSDAPYTLTLTTCTPKYTSRNRLIIWADMVSPAVEADAA